jgi:hypothetical protein
MESARPARSLNTMSREVLLVVVVCGGRKRQGETDTSDYSEAVSKEAKCWFEQEEEQGGGGGNVLLSPRDTHTTTDDCFVSQGAVCNVQCSRTNTRIRETVEMTGNDTNSNNSSRSSSRRKKQEEQTRTSARYCKEQGDERIRKNRTQRESCAVKIALKLTERARENEIDKEKDTINMIRRCVYVYVWADGDRERERERSQGFRTMHGWRRDIPF